MEGTLRSGSFPVLSALAKHNSGNSSGSKGNNGSDVSYYINLPVEPAHAESQPDSPQLALAPSIPHTT